LGEWSGSGKQTGERMGEQTDAHEQIGGRMDRRMGKPMADAAGEHGDALAAHGRR
jgi:hypothetical protein